MKEFKGITLIALVITIIILLILAGITIATLTGENGLFARAKQAEREAKKAQYFEEINLEILDEQTERFAEVKEELFIKSIQKRLEKKEWINEVLMYNETEEGLKDETDPEKANILIVETRDKYEIIIEVNNNELTAKIRDYFEKVERKNKYIVTLNHENGTSVSGAGTYEEGTIINIETTGDGEFIGWYNGDTLYSEDKKVQITVTENINLVAKYRILVSSITLKDGNTTLNSTSNVTGYCANVSSLNDTKVITATISPTNATNSELEWISSNPNIVSVDSTGKLTFKGVSGSTKSCTITCRSKDGNVVTSFNAMISEYREFIQHSYYSTPYNMINFGQVIGSWPNGNGRVFFRNPSSDTIAVTRVDKLLNFDDFTKVTFVNFYIDDHSKFCVGWFRNALTGITSNWGEVGIWGEVDNSSSNISQALGTKSWEIPKGIGNAYFACSLELLGSSYYNKAFGAASIYLNKSI